VTNYVPIIVSFGAASARDCEDRHGFRFQQLKNTHLKRWELKKRRQKKQKQFKKNSRPTEKSGHTSLPTSETMFNLVKTLTSYIWGDSQKKQLIQVRGTFYDSYANRWRCL
jgi:hypothetical protein